MHGLNSNSNKCLKIKKGETPVLEMSSRQNGFMSLYKLPLRDESRSASFNFFLPFNMPTSVTKSP